MDRNVSGDLFWQDPQSVLLLNPRLPKDLVKKISDAVSQQYLNGIVWLKSSGTESGLRGHKVVALSKSAILAAASSVNRFFKIDSKDVWLNPLPEFHIGGLAIGARCFLSGARELSFESWDVDRFHQQLEDHAVTITSLVPTQIFDLIEKSFRSPPSLRMVLVGGGALSPENYFRGRDLGWPLLPSYGMTETAAVVAAAPLDSLNERHFPKAKILPHVKFKAIGDKFEILSPSLYSGFLFVGEQGEWTWEKRPEPFLIDDHLNVDGEYLKVLGRESELVKVLGETVNLIDLKNTLQIKTPQNLVILPLPDSRRGFELHLVIEGSPFPATLDEVNQGLMPYERIKQIHFLDSFPRTELGKINMASIRQALSL